MSRTVTNIIAAAALLICILTPTPGIAESADDLAGSVDEQEKSGLVGLLTRPASRIVGTWIANVTLIDCTTRQPSAAPGFRAIVAFHEGGTVSEASGPSVRRTPSYGTWRWRGRSSFEASSVLLTYDANGAAVGDQIISRVIEISGDGSRFVADTETTGRDLAGNVQFRGCARGEARRFE
jgi:hypothetical protein